MSRATRISRKQAVQYDLDKLANTNHDRTRILLALDLLKSCFADDSWTHLAGTNRKTLNGAVIRIRKCAEEIENLNKHTLMWGAIVYGPPDNRRFGEIPQLLHSYAGALQKQIRCSGPKKRAMENSVKAYIVAIVQQTGRNHDAEVAGLINAVHLNPGVYSTENHAEWRRNHKALIEQARTSK